MILSIKHTLAFVSLGVGEAVSLSSLAAEEAV